MTMASTGGPEDYDADEFGADEVDAGAPAGGTGGGDDVEQVEEAELTDRQAMEAAERQQYGQTGDAIDTTIGNMGGAGASATGPDISQQSSPMPGNHSDLPAGER